MPHLDYLSLAFLSLLAVGGAVWLIGEIADMFDQPE